MDAERKARVEQENAQRVAAEAARKQALVATDYAQHGDFNKFYDGLSVGDMKLLDTENASFRERVKQLDADAHASEIENLIKSFRGLPVVEQERAYAEFLPWQKQAINADYDRFNALTPEEQTAETSATVEPAAKTPEQIETERQAAVQAEVDRLATEATAPPAVAPVDTEDLYDGIEKLGQGSYKLTVDPGDGTPAEVFFGTSQKECFKALRKSKANATKELRRRAKKVQITDELKALQVEVLNYAPLLQPLKLTPDEIFQLTEDQKDPTKVLAATAKLRSASLTPDECARHNESIIRQRYADGHQTAVTWIQNNPQFYNCAENIDAMQSLMAGLNWAVTINNLDLALKTLVEQGVLLDRPEEETTIQPQADPAPVVPAAVVPATTPASAPAAAATVTPAPAKTVTPGALPEPVKVLRPGSSSTATMPTHRIESVSHVVPPVVLTAEEYNMMPAAVAKQRYLREPAFKVQVDDLIRLGKI